MKTGLAAAVAALTLLLIVPVGASAKGMLPWPSDQYTKRDKRTDTGLRLNLRRADMPRNKDGKPIDPTDMNRADGFSPGSAMLMKVPGLDTPAAARRSKLPPLTNLRRGLAKRSPVVVINARTGKRHPIWAELDSNAAKRLDRLLIIRPARNFEEGERYIVALRNLRNARGGRIDSRAPSGPPLRADPPRAEEGGGRSPPPVPRLGLHRGKRAQPRRPHAPHP